MKLLDKIMLAAIAQFVGVIALVTIMLVSVRQLFPGTAGGGDALLMVFLPILGYLLACLVLIPCVLYRLFRGSRGQMRLTRMQTMIASVGVLIIATPPVVINLLPFFR